MNLTDASREELLDIIAGQAQMIHDLQVRIKELEDRLAGYNRNSSKPPSTDNSRRRTRSLRQPTGKKPGGQPGHPGQTRHLVEKPDRVIAHRPDKCAACGT